MTAVLQSMFFLMFLGTVLAMKTAPHDGHDEDAFEQQGWPERLSTVALNPVTLMKRLFP